jgi:putative oxidoreductase
VRRLYSTFAHGAPGLGLLLLRAVAGIAAMLQAAVGYHSSPSLGLNLLHLLSGVVGLFLLVGLWTPIAGTLLAVLASWSAFMHPADPWSWILLGSLSAALALLGPGAWSVDARLFGWKRVELPDRET